MTVTALIVAAGKGERFGGGMPKQYRMLGGKPVLRWAVEALIGHPAVKSTRVVVGDGQEGMAKASLKGIDIGEFVAGAPSGPIPSARASQRSTATRCLCTMPPAPSAPRR